MLSASLSKISKILFISAVLFGVFGARPAEAATINAATCNFADVSAAVTSAVNGDTVFIPAGDCTWTSKLNFAKAITILGAGCPVDVDGRAISPCRTIIRDNSLNGGNPLIVGTCVAGRTQRLSGVEFRNGGRTGFSGQAVVQFSCPTQVNTFVRVDHTVFNHAFPADGKDLGFDNALGVVDHNTFLSARGMLLFYGLRWNGVGGNGDESWRAPVEWGSSDFIFVEDNTFVVDAAASCTDGYAGARFVLRYNKFVGCTSGQHGTDSSGRWRSTRAVESYKNTYDLTGTSRSWMHENRDGSLLLWGNTGVNLNLGSQPAAALLKSYRSISSFSPWGQQDGTSPWDVNDPNNPYDPGTACRAGLGKACAATSAGALNVTVSGAGWTTNQWAGYIVHKLNCVPANGRPCASPVLSNTATQITFSSAGGEGTNLSFAAGDTFHLNKVIAGLDQPGRGGGALLSGLIPLPPVGGIGQVDFPSMQWLNSNNGVFNLVSAAGPDCPGCRKNITYLDYESSKTFDATIATNRSSIGVGLLATRPGTCTAGVMYWATDVANWNAANVGNDGTMYKCTATNTWTQFYTPYTYPHPLTNGDLVPPVPGNAGALAVSNLTSNGLTVSWTRGTDNLSPQNTLQYQVRRSVSNNIASLANAEANGIIAQSYTTDAASANITGLAAGTAYFLTIIVRDQSGNRAVYATVNATTPGTSDTTAPTPGSSGTITTSTVASTSLTLNWTKAIDNVSAPSALLYQVRRSVSNNIGTVTNAETNGTIVQAYSADIAFADLHGLTPSTPYFFNVIVQDAAGNKAVYTTVSVTTTAAADTTAPVPTGLILISGVTSTSALLAWSPATDDTTAPASLQYEVRRSITNNITGVANAEANGTIVQAYAANLAAANAAGLAPNTQYFFTVIVKDATGNKAAYSVATTTTLVLTDTAPPSVAFTTPAAGARVSGTAVVVSAGATDNVAVRAVWFMLDGVPLSGELTSAPYSTLWNTILVADGLHTLTAHAEDTSGRLAIPSTITVLVGNLTTLYSIPPSGGQSFDVSGSSSSTTTVSHARIDGDSNSPTGIAIIDYQPGTDTPLGILGEATTSKVLVSEAGVPATVETRSGMAYVDIGRSLSTGVAIANGTTSDAVIDYFFTDAEGSKVKQGSVTLFANRQMSAFLDSPPFSAPNPFRGTFTFSSSVPIAVIATRGLTNERNDFVFSTMPISTTMPDTAPLLPMFADGGGWNTQVVLTNSSVNTLTGTIEFFGQGSSTAAATALSVAANGTTGTVFPYSIPPRSMTRLVTQGLSSNATNSGSVRITPERINPFINSIPNAFAILSYQSNDVTVSETSVFATPTGTSYLMYVESSTSTQGQILSGIAIANASETPNAVVLELTGLNGTATGGTQSFVLPGNGEVSKFLGEMFPTLSGDFRGLLKITATAPIGVVDLRARYNTRNDFLVTTIPAVNLNAPETGAIVFPHVVSGGGYSTQIILFGQPGGTAAGKVAFTSANGTPVSGAASIAP
jgi:hypothetical protein